MQQGMDLLIIKTSCKLFQTQCGTRSKFKATENGASRYYMMPLIHELAHRSLCFLFMSSCLLRFVPMMSCCQHIIRCIFSASQAICSNIYVMSNLRTRNKRVRAVANKIS